jgi:transcriptional regulator with XRE-family HTH domain
VRPSPTPQVALGRAIGLRRSQTGLTQEALADAADMAVRTLRAIEAGTGNPRTDVLDRIARGLGWPMWRLAKLADGLETEDRRPTDEPLPSGV